jgi:hypothetical protein
MATASRKIKRSQSHSAAGFGFGTSVAVTIQTRVANAGPTELALTRLRQSAMHDKQRRHGVTDLDNALGGSYNYLQHGSRPRAPDQPLFTYMATMPTCPRHCCFYIGLEIRCHEAPRNTPSRGGHARAMRSPARKRTRLRQHLRPPPSGCCLSFIAGPNSISAFSAARTAQQWRGGKSATRQPASLPAHRTKGCKAKALGQRQPQECA